MYYNYCAASAGSYCWGNGADYTGSPSNDPVADSLRDITDDICPYRWRLPTGGSTGEFQTLYDLYSGGSPNQVTVFQTALSTPLSGRFNSGETFYQGLYGQFWSSTCVGTVSMNYLRVYSDNASPSEYHEGRQNGFSIRCILAE